jgi:hypothetical protein
MLVKIRGTTVTRSGDKLSELIQFKETEQNALRLQMCGDRLAASNIDNLARVVFRFGLLTLESAISAGLLEGVEL